MTGRQSSLHTPADADGDCGKIAVKQIKTPAMVLVPDRHIACLTALSF
jgi:hypothetical protein